MIEFKIFKIQKKKMENRKIENYLSVTPFQSYSK